MLRILKKHYGEYLTKFSFGATCAIITNLGLIMGLYLMPNARFSIIAGILVVAVADNISDSFGIHIYQESEKRKQYEVWLSTFTNFLSRMLVSLVFILFILLLPMAIAVICSLAWGLLLLTVISYFIASNENSKPYLVVLEHLGIAALVIVVSKYLGLLLTKHF
jgi:VIT1/CCC1 family predicted Fe2+/Mn2+ transporter